MEVTQRKYPANTTALRELIVRRWEELGQPPVDAELLASVQEDVLDRFSDTVMSPASIARLLADEGAELRHPAIIEFDAAWRERQTQTPPPEFADLEHWIARSPLSLKQAREFITKLEEGRLEFEGRADDSGGLALRRMAIEARQSAQAMGANNKLAANLRAEQSEIAEWLKVWLQTPALFPDWLELRRRTAEFRERFPADAP